MSLKSGNAEIKNNFKQLVSHFSVLYSNISYFEEFKFVRKVLTVHDFLREKECLHLLKHPDIIMATTAIVDR